MAWDLDHRWRGLDRPVGGAVSAASRRSVPATTGGYSIGQCHPAPDGRMNTSEQELQLQRLGDHRFDHQADYNLPIPSCPDWDRLQAHGQLTAASRLSVVFCPAVARQAELPLRERPREETSMKKPIILLQALAFLASMSGTTPVAAEPVHGVTDTEIIIGTVTDLSGVTAIQGVNNANAIRLLFDEANAKGGINGRKIRYVVEDSQYQVPRAVQAMNKLLNNDKVFMTLQDGGTPMNNATWPMAIEKGVPKLLPLTAARSMYEPFHHLKFSQTSSYVDQMRAGTKYFVEQRSKKALCVMYQDTDFGKD